MMRCAFEGVGGPGEKDAAGGREGRNGGGAAAWGKGGGGVGKNKAEAAMTKRAHVEGKQDGDDADVDPGQRAETGPGGSQKRF